uniref:Ghrelin O-acyltransferase n=1 Tax=Gadus morhua TaxID=8049 RepID=A0A8C5AHR7_GADMO
MDWLWEQHWLLWHQCLALPLAVLYSLGRSLTPVSPSRYVSLGLGGCLLAVGTMGVYSLVVLVAVLGFALLVVWVPPDRVHGWVFWGQMLWQTVCHLLLQHGEGLLPQGGGVRALVAVSSLMLLTQRVTSVSMDLQEGRIHLPQGGAASCPLFLLSLCSYVLSFPTLLGGPLYPYSRFVGCVEGSGPGAPPLPLGAVSLKLLQVLLLEGVRAGLLRGLPGPGPAAAGGPGPAGACLCLWGVALALRLRYYSHWGVSEGLNLAAGFGPQGPDRGGLSDGDPWTTEASPRVSEFARRWNATTAAWLRRLVFRRGGRCPLLLTFGFSAWWHGLRPGQAAGFLGWGLAVRADYTLHRHVGAALSSRWGRGLYAGLSWAHTQAVITWVVLLVEARDSMCFFKYIYQSIIYQVTCKLKNEKLYEIHLK